MNDLNGQPEQRKELLRTLLLKLHGGDDPEVLRRQLIEALRGIPYHEVVEVEQGRTLLTIHFLLP